MKISACWITKNEAANIARSIHSVKNAVDEMVVTDTGSTDDTIAVAEALGARVEHFQWIDDFAAARNFTLSKVSGDLVIFLDADERFEPGLTPEKRQALETLFRQNKALEALSFQSVNIDEQTGAVTHTISAGIMLRNKAQNRYQGRIHEFLVTPDGYQGHVGAASLQIYHTGYSESVAPQKLRRNAAIMEACLAEAKDEEEYARYAAYLVREFFYGQEYEQALTYMKKMLAHSDALDRVCAIQGRNFLSALYAAILTAAHENSPFSGAEIYDKLVVPFQKHYADDPAASLVPLVHQVLFAWDEERFLREWEPAFAEANRKKPSPVTVFLDMTGLLSARAAQSLFRRGDRLGAMECAVRALQAGARTAPVLDILLEAVKGQPPQDIVYLLNGCFTLNDPRQLRLLAESTKQREGFAEVHAYYAKKWLAKTSQTDA